MDHRDLEKRLRGMQRSAPPATLDRRMDELFDGARDLPVDEALEPRLGRIPRVPVPGTLDRRMEALFGEADGAPREAPHPFRLRPAWAAAAIILVMAVGFIVQNRLDYGPTVVTIVPEGGLKSFLVGSSSSAADPETGIFTRGGCTVETVWPVDAPALDRHPVNGNRPGGGA